MLPIIAKDGSFSYFGRSDNTTFASGLMLFNLKLGIALDEDNRSRYQVFWERQWDHLISMPRTTKGWLKVNLFDGGNEASEDTWSRDAYTQPIEYSAAAICYVLLGQLVASSTTVDFVRPKTARETGASRDLGVVRLTNGLSEAILRTQGELVVGDRRYMAPTILRLETDAGVVVGAIPKSCEDDIEICTATFGRYARHLQRLLHFVRIGLDELNVCGVGFLPHLLRGSEICFPFELLSLRVDSDCVATDYAMCSARHLGWDYALRELTSLVRKNLHQRVRRPESPKITRVVGARLSRTVRLTSDGLMIDDRLSGAGGWSRLRLSTRTLAGTALASVEGLDFERHLLGWSSDGLTNLNVYSAHYAGEAAYSIALKATPKATEALIPV